MWWNKLFQFVVTITFYAYPSDQWPLSKTNKHKFDISITYKVKRILYSWKEITQSLVFFFFI